MLDMWPEHAVLLLQLCRGRRCTNPRELGKPVRMAGYFMKKFGDDPCLLEPQHEDCGSKWHHVSHPRRSAKLKCNIKRKGKDTCR